MTSSDKEIRIIHEFLSALDERDLYEPLKHLFLAQGYQVWIVHGVHEHGKDLVGTKPAEHNLLVNVKKGDIDQHRWKTDVSPSLEEMMKRPINHTGVEESLPRRPVFAFNGILLPAVDQKVNEFNEYYRKKGDPELEIWDINRLALEFHEHLLSINLVGDSYLEDIQRLVFSISDKSLSRDYSNWFVDKHLHVKGSGFLAFRLAVLYVLRRAEAKNNPYAFFHFAEYALVKMWQKMHELGDFSALDNFDAVHEIYLNFLESWSESLNALFGKKAGLVDWEAGQSLEIISYPLRTFDALRRIAYLGFCSLLNNQKEKGDTFANTILKIIANNRAASTPLAEWNYGDLGLALTVLHATGHTSEARSWLFDLTDFLVSLYMQGYEVMPRGGQLSQIFHIIFPDRSKLLDEQSCLIPLLFEFAIILRAPEAFSTFRKRLVPSLRLYELGMPPENHELEIYQPKVINSVYREIHLPLTWRYALGNGHLVFRNLERRYTPIIHSRPQVLVLLSNVYRDRNFPEIWRQNTLSRHSN